MLGLLVKLSGTVVVTLGVYIGFLRYITTAAFSIDKYTFTWAFGAAVICFIFCIRLKVK